VASLIFGSKSLNGNGVFPVLTTTERSFSSSVGEHLGGAGGWRWTIVSVCVGLFTQSFHNNYPRTVSSVVSMKIFCTLFYIYRMQLGKKYNAKSLSRNINQGCS
jgi:hypothetical protein